MCFLVMLFKMNVKFVGIKKNKNGEKTPNNRCNLCSFWDRNCERKIDKHRLGYYFTVCYHWEEMPPCQIKLSSISVHYKPCSL